MTNYPFNHSVVHFSCVGVRVYPYALGRRIIMTESGFFWLFLRNRALVLMWRMQPLSICHAIVFSKTVRIHKRVYVFYFSKLCSFSSKEPVMVTGESASLIDYVLFSHLMYD